jgi:uncharacterized protein (TIGR02145 family)
MKGAFFMGKFTRHNMPELLMTATVLAMATVGTVWLSGRGKPAGQEPVQEIQEPAQKPVFIAYGALIDDRDGQIYKTVEIGQATWMAQNLNYQAGNSWCHRDSAGNCAKYGRLYDWNTAMNACPAGWHLPSDAEWAALIGFVGGGDVAGKMLKSTSGWNRNDGSIKGSGNGTDYYGFSALPGGERDANGFLGNTGDNGQWWASTEGTATGAHYRRFDRFFDGVGGNSVGPYDINLYDKRFGFSVRCVQDAQPPKGTVP